MKYILILILFLPTIISCKTSKSPTIVIPEKEYAICDTILPYNIPDNGLPYPDKSKCMNSIWQITTEGIFLIGYTPCSK